MATTTQESLRRFNLSAQEIQNLTGWPYAIIEEWLNMIENALNLAKTIDSGIDNGDILESRVAALEVSVATLSSQITSINQSISDIELDISGINAQLETIFQQIDSIDQAVQSILSDIGLIFSQLRNIEANFSDLEQLQYSGDQ